MKTQLKLPLGPVDHFQEGCPGRRSRQHDSACPGHRLTERSPQLMNLGAEIHGRKQKAVPTPPFSKVSKSLKRDPQQQRERQVRPLANEVPCAFTVERVTMRFKYSQTLSNKSKC